MGYWEPLTSNQEDGHLNGKKDAHTPPAFIPLQGDPVLWLQLTAMVLQP